MDMTHRFLAFQALIICPFLVGATIRRYRLIKDPSALTKKMILANLAFIEPVVAFWSTWGLSLSPELVVLPLSGFLLVLVGMAFGIAAGRILRLEGRSRATFHISSALANHGFTLGAYLCFLVLGERGLGLASIFLSYFLPVVFLFIFPYARMSSAKGSFGHVSVRGLLVSIQNMPLYAVITAVVLSSLGISRPDVAFPVDVMIMVSMALYYLTLGFTFDVPAFFSFLKANAVLAAVKFLAVPLVAMCVLSVLELDKDIETVILLEAFMPAAIYSVVASVLFDLDAPMASAMFVMNTLVFLFAVLPFLWYARLTILALI